MSRSLQSQDRAPARAFPVLAAVAQIDRHTDASDVVRHAFRAAQIEGHEPFVQSASFDHSVAAQELLPDDARVERSATTDSSVVAFARSPRGGLLVTVLPRSATVVASAATEALAESIVTDVRKRAPTPCGDGTVSIRTWHMSGDGPRSNDRRISAPTLEDVARNYPTTVRAGLERLYRVDRPTNTGKLILWHGDPGTGKTTAVRALLRHWRPWCAGQYVADPEQLFANPGYIADVLTRSPAPRQGPTLANAGDPEALWRLIIAEDSDEFLRASARRDAGAGLGRLLNLTDGILGQGFNTLILLTTNEELSRLHPALTRPGRCLAQVDFKRFGPAEARRWLPDGIEQPKSDATLAELFELRGDFSRIGHDNQGRISTGAYL